MASRGRNSRSSSSRSKESVESRILTGLLPKSWLAFGTLACGLIGSYLGCVPNSDNLTSKIPAVLSDILHSDSESQPAHSHAGAMVTTPTSTAQGSGYGQHAGNNSSATGASSHSTPSTGLERDSILIGSFNIQTFGRAKMSRPDVVNVLVDIARRFDILAIQELRDIQEGTIPEFLQLINGNGSRYQAAVSPRISYGQGNHAEQLVFVYDTDQIELLGEPYVASDPRQVMFRPPYIGHFRYRSRYPQAAFSFVLMNVHVSPQQTAIEFAALEDIFARVMQTHALEDDFIMLGDLNEEPGKYLTYRWLNNQYAAIPSHWKTNTAETKNYDNFVFDFRRTSEFTGQAGVLNLKTYYQLTREQADLISDHMPVWSLFSSRESTPQNMVQQPAMIR